MNGERLFFDTNAIVSLLRGNGKLIHLAQGARWIGVSVISVIEFLVFPGINEHDKSIFDDFLRRVEVAGIGKDDSTLIDSIIEIRRRHSLKLPDAIIAGMALHHKATIVTADKQFGSLKNIPVKSF